MKAAIIIFLLPVNIFAQEFFHAYSVSDTVEIGKGYHLDFSIDTNQIHDLSKISIMFGKLELKRSGNSFAFDIMSYMPGNMQFDFTIIRSDITPPAVVNYSKTIFGSKPAASPDFIVLPDVKPVFVSDEYKDFDSYFVGEVFKRKIAVTGKLIILFTVMKDGTVRVDNLRSKTIAESSKEKIIELISGSKWIPGSMDGKPANVQLARVFGE